MSVSRAQTGNTAVSFAQSVGKQSSAAEMIDSKGPGLTVNQRLWLGTGSSAPKEFFKMSTSTPRIDRWTPRHIAQHQAHQHQTMSKPNTAKSPMTTPKATSMTDLKLPIEQMERLPTTSSTFTGTVDPEIDLIQKKLQTQLKGRRHFRVQEGTEDGFMSKESFSKTLTRYGLDLSNNERDSLFDYYDRDGHVAIYHSFLRTPAASHIITVTTLDFRILRTGELDYEEFMIGIRGSEFVQTARSYGFETPDPGFHDEDPEGGFGHYVLPADDLVEHTPRSAKAWQQQRALDACPFGTDRRIFGGKWQYRTSSLIKAEAVVAPRYGKTSFPARKTIDDVIAVIADKLQERSKNTLAFTRSFNHFDTDKNGSIDRTEFEKLLDIYNISLTDEEIGELFDHFGGHDEGISYLPFVKTVEDFRRKHPLGGTAGVGRSVG